MSRKAHKTLLWLVGILAIIGVGVLVLTKTSVGESVKKESAKLFDYEYIPNQEVAIEGMEAAVAADSIYKDFRKKFRFHYQTIGMASFADSSRLILLSDIPPHFETDSIALIFANFTHKVELRKHPIGYDGYVTDVVILMGNATQENCDKLIRRLNRELFFSDYKPTVMTLPVEEKRHYFAKENIDYQITLDEFNTWFMEDGEGFIVPQTPPSFGHFPLKWEEFLQLDNADKQLKQGGSKNVMTVSDLFAAKARGVYFSKEPGFVAWALPKNADLADTLKPLGNQTFVQSIRQFTLDADLILGALADSSTLVIIGRERQSPLYELPPLQVESILLLASTTEKELSQSLDINDLMAGKMVNGKDWCPTYLSKELENTEFGDLMTITDVLLKDWSERGTIQEGFYRYPEPGYYPFDRPLFRKLGLNELVYNWNTAGAMYANDCEGYTIYTLGRTGSLPVSYFNSQERSQSVGYRYESQAYHYFATLGCTDLARVVQYTALYQLFIDNNISYSGNTYPAFPKNKPFLLYKPTTELLNKIRGLRGEEIALLADSLSHRSFRNYQKEQVDKQLHENEKQHNFTYTDENRDRIYQDVHHNTTSGFSRSFNEVKGMLNALSEEQFKKLARYLSYPRGVKINNRESYNTLLHGRRVNRLMREVGKNNLDLLGMDLANVKNWYAASLKDNAGRYMKTSSLIVTYNDMLTTGGHNLSSRISRVKTMTNYKRTRNYTPTDYEQKTDKPSSTSTPAKKKSSKATAKSKPANKGNSHIRPRNSVISNASRTKRGL